jgi:hypothetical protein
MNKTAIIVLGLFSAFLCALLEQAATGRVTLFDSKIAVAGALLSLALVYWWFRQDAMQRRFRYGSPTVVLVVAFSIIGLPVYFFRSRGLRRGLVAVGWMLLLILTAGLAEFAGEYLGAVIGTAMGGQYPQ